MPRGWKAAEDAEAPPSNGYGLTPEEYRAKWNLPKDYPMVAPVYASHRSSLAKKIGLGRKAAESSAEALPLSVESNTDTIESVKIQKVPTTKRGRKKGEAKLEEAGE
jgi:hypothetical protein